MAEPREYKIDGTRGLIDLSWSQRAPQIQLDDIDRDPRYSQYPYQEDDKYEDNEEEIEVDEWALGKTGSIHMSAPTSTRCSYRRLEATYSYPSPDQTLGSSRSIHMDTDVAMEMGGLGMGTGRTGTHMAMPWREAAAGTAQSALHAGFSKQHYKRNDGSCYRNLRKVYPASSCR